MSDRNNATPEPFDGVRIVTAIDRDEEIVKQLTRIEAKLDAMRWRPIHTAPTDGATVAMRWHGVEPGFAYWDQIDDDWGKRAGWWDINTGAMVDAGYAWRPADPEWNEEA